MNFLPEELETYIENHTKPEPEVLKKLNRETHAHVLMPQMLSGHLQGRFLKMLTGMIQPQHVLEIGTFTGYSALCIAEGLPDGGTIHTIDINEELLAMVQKYIKESGSEKKVKTYTGNALEIIPKMNEVFDIVFIDADKKNYLNYYNIVFDKVRKGGYIIADNVLWSGKVIEKSAKPDEDTKSIMAYNNKVMTDPRVENVLVPIRDGLMIARKLV
ncbi:MAG TPA: O-methyltransferase [Bacteroidia bacterium]|jgi:caffeoyl-CoA O-methyltransferase|nr:O-methyltransferase [Bacteroidia bacterium]